MLLEALIAILIFSFGILALVGMQANSIAIVADAKYRTDASFFADQIVGQMWVNQTNLATYACDPCTSSNGNADTQAWYDEMSSGALYSLPGVGAGAAQPSIVVNGNVVTVTVNWQPRNGATHSHVVTAQVNCC